ncbi:MAG TPA: hypothetical protein PKO06_16500, partial [Candidatus Ozemobacteraceae bacterium]|nr:hypothetical protein [Candidatus Ozemobacteraceae bacterium]
MFAVADFFKKLRDMPFAEIFETQLDGYDDLTYVWDILARIQKRFIARRVKQDILGTVEPGAWLQGADIFIGKGTRVEAGA